jgi:hypothetical protein
MVYRFTRAQLNRIILGAVSAMVICAIAIFTAARHFAV